eukprot:m51a1_g2312 putative protein (799) ;mRNA; r:469845-473222
MTEAEDPASAGSAPAESKPGSRRRVKLYKLLGDQWTDQGTGHVSSTYEEATETLSLMVKSEENGSILINTKVFAEDIYQRQQETLIVWCDPETQEDLALSFQELGGCREIWDLIVDYQARRGGAPGDGGGGGSGAPGGADDDDRADAMRTSGAGMERTSSDGWQSLVDVELPKPSIATVKQVAQVIAENSEAHKASLAACLLRQSYVPKIIELFEECEDLEDAESLRVLYGIFKTLVMLNDPSLMEVLFSDDNILKVIGALEYDPDIPPENRMCHRDFVTKQTTFKEVVPFNSPELVSKIHQTFRLQYLKDVILPRVLDDPTCATLNSLIFFNQLEIVTHVQNDHPFQEQLFSRLRSSEVGSEQRKDQLAFLHELFNLAKNLQPANRTQFFRTITSAGLFESLDSPLGDDRFETRMATTEVLGITLMHDPSLLRSFILSQKPRKLLDQILSRFFRDPDIGIMGVSSDILKALLDTETMADSAEKEPFLEMIYRDVLPLLVAPLQKSMRSSSDAVDLRQAPQPPLSAEAEEAVKSNVCDLLSFCLVRHGFRMRAFMLGNDVCKKVMKLTFGSHKHLALAALRFLKTVVATKDDYYLRHVVERDLFKGVMEVFRRNSTRYNLMNSAVIDLLEYVRQENIKELVKHIVEKYGDEFRNIRYVDTFSKLILRYEQNKEYEDRPPSSVTAAATFNEPPQGMRGVDSDEEKYFNDTDSDEEESRAQQQKKLVDYEDDDTEGPQPAKDEASSAPAASAAVAPAEPDPLKMQVDQESKVVSDKPAAGDAGTDQAQESLRKQKRPRLT